MKYLSILLLISLSCFAQTRQLNGTRLANTLNAVITNLTLPNVPITNLLRLTAQGSITNAKIGTGLAFDGTTLSANGSVVGAGGGNAQSTGSTTVTNIPYYLDATGTNIGPSTVIFLYNGTNFAIKGNLYAQNVYTTNEFVIASLTFDDGSGNSFRFTTQPMSVDINEIQAPAPFSGYKLYTLTGTTNMTASQAPTTGIGSLVLATSPTLVTPAIGVATATSINANALLATNGITDKSLAITNIVRTDSNGRLGTVTIGSNLTFDGTTLSSTSGGSVPTGTGFPHITAGSQDAAARAINVSTSDITGVSPIPNGGTGLSTIGGAGSVLTSDGTLNYYRTAGDSIRLNDEFANGSVGMLGWSSTISGTGITAAPVIGAPADSGHFGVEKIGTGAGVGSAGLRLGSSTANLFTPGGADIWNEWVVRLDVLSGGAGDGIIRIGLMSADAATDGVMFSYDSGSTFWQIKTIKASTATTTATATTLSANTWYRITIHINAAGTSANFYVNGTEVSGSPISTNIPIVALDGLSIISNTSGTTAHIFYIDYFDFFAKFTTPR